MISNNTDLQAVLTKIRNREDVPQDDQDVYILREQVSLQKDVIVYYKKQAETFQEEYKEACRDLRIAKDCHKEYVQGFYDR